LAGNVQHVILLLLLFLPPVLLPFLPTFPLIFEAPGGAVGGASERIGKNGRGNADGEGRQEWEEGERLTRGGKEIRFFKKQVGSRAAARAAVSVVAVVAVAAAAASPVENLPTVAAALTSG